MNQVKLSVIVWLLVSTLLCTFAKAEDKNQLTKEIIEVLSGIEWEPPLSYWSKIGVKAIPVLTALARDNQQRMYVRIRAVRALAAFSTDSKVFNTVASFLKVDQPTLLRRAAARTLVRGWGTKALPILKQYLTDKDPLLREAIGFSLSRISSPEARELIEKMIQTEKHPIILDSLNQALKIWKANFTEPHKQ